MGSNLEEWGGMGTAWSYDKDGTAEYEAIRTKAAFMDVSGLHKVHVIGPHAAKVIDRATTRDPAKIKPGRSVYAGMLNDDGKFVDDCVIFRTGPNAWMVVHGTGAGHEQLTMAALGRNVAILFDDDMHDISLQGPLAVDFLEKAGVPGIRDLAYFSHMQTTLYDCPVMISRTGYTGERGYEIFCKGVDAPKIWDTFVETGKPHGIIPSRFTTLDRLRAESYLLFYPFDNSEMYPFADEKCGDTLWELGLDFTVSKGKTGFRGAEEHYRLQGKERFKIYGIMVEGTQQVDDGSPLFKDGKEVGVATVGLYSKLHGYNVAIARMPVDCAVDGVEMVVKSGGKDMKCKAHALPFDDPKKAKRTAKG